MENNFDSDRLRSDRVYDHAGSGRPNEVTQVTTNKTKKILISIIGIVVVLALAMLALRYNNLLGATVARGGAKVAQGAVLSAQVKASTRVQRVELCQKKNRGQQCTALVYSRTGNTVQATVPAAYPLGQTTFKVLGLSAQRKPVTVQKVVTIIAAPPTDTGGGGGNGGGGGGNDGGGTTPPAPYEFTPTPTPSSPPSPYSSPTPTVTPGPSITPPIPYGSQ